jgi:chromosome segregation ATPase
MKSILSLFKPSKAEQELAADIELGMNGKKPSTTPATSRSSHVKTITPSTVASGELEQLRASLADMDFKLQSIANERDQLKAEFSSYRQSANEDTRDLEKLNRDLKTQLRETGQQLSLHIASQAQLGPLPDFNEDSSPQDRTEAAYMKLARQIKSGSTGEPTTQRIERP